jgi:hypothetical protein
MRMRQPRGGVAPVLPECHIQVTNAELRSASKKERIKMAVRKSFLGPAPNHPELDKLLEETRGLVLTDAQLEEQRISFAYGNAPADQALITKDTVRTASKSIRLQD